MRHDSLRTAAVACGSILYASAGLAAFAAKGALLPLLLLWLLVLPCAAGLIFWPRSSSSASKIPAELRPGLVQRAPAPFSAPQIPVDRLAAGVAHDINNLLAVMRASVEVLEERIPADNPLRAETVAIADAINRGSTLAGQLVVHPESEPAAVQPFDLTRAIHELEPLLARMLPRSVQLHLKADGTRSVLAQQSQVEQLIVNLVANARDALAGSGEIWIDLSSKWLDRTELPREGPLEPGFYVVLRVRDTGPGISDAVLPRIFEPFFTTKPRGLGTGLGLAASRDLVCAAGGDVMVASRPGEGTCFKVLLPDQARRSAHAAIRTPIHQFQPTFGPRTPGGGNRVWASEPNSETVPRAPQVPPAPSVLVVDDQPELLRASARVLKRAGHEVFTASDAETALEVVRANPSRISLLVTDVVLPGRSGPELARELRKHSQRLAIVYVTGLSSVADHGLDPTDVLVKKPFHGKDLLSAVRAAESRVQPCRDVA